MIKKISSLQHPLVKHLVKLQRDPIYRREKQTLVLDGIKPINEVYGKCKTLHLLTQDLTLVPPEASPSIISLATPEVIKKISSMKNPEGLIAEVAAPAFESLKGKKQIVALDGIADPGNMGTLFRTALALGWDGVFILENCVDPFNDKVIRAARGAIFRLPLMKGTWRDLELFSEDNNFPILIADASGGTIDKFQDGCILVLGNEAKGSSHSASPHYQKVAIPMPGEMESLNVAVAGGILMHLIRSKQ